MLEVGQKAPAFRLVDQNGKKRSLSEFRGKPLVLYFYPKDDTPGCTRQACAFRDARKEYQAAGAAVVGVSPDTAESHEAFTTRYELPFTLLADPEKTASEAYGVWKERTLYGRKFMGIERTTFVIDAKGIIRKIFRRVRVDGHADRVLEAVAALS